MDQKNGLAILHTTPATIGAMKDVCGRLLPGVRVWNYLDDSLLPQINREGRIGPSVAYRFQSLIALAAAARPEVILSACSSVGGLMEQARELHTIPLARIDEPMAALAASRPGKIVVCATVKSTLEPTMDLLRRKAGPERQLDCLLIREAGALLAQGRGEEYLALIAGRLKAAADRYDVVVLAQASMAKAAELMPERLRAKLLSSPETGIMALQKYFDGGMKDEP